MAIQQSYLRTGSLAAGFVSPSASRNRASNSSFVPPTFRPRARNFSLSSGMVKTTGFVSTTSICFLFSWIIPMRMPGIRACNSPLHCCNKNSLSTTTMNLRPMRAAMLIAMNVFPRPQGTQMRPLPPTWTNCSIISFWYSYGVPTNFRSSRIGSPSTNILSCGSPNSPLAQTLGR